MKKMIFKGALLAIAGVVLMAGSSSANLITNGSFEDGTYTTAGFDTLTAGTTNATNMTGWTVVSGSIDWIGDYWQASDGNRSLDLAGSYANGLIVGVDFATVIGQTYTVEFDMAGNPDKGYDKALIGATVDLSGDFFRFEQDTNTHTNMGWQTMSFTFIAEDITTQLSFGNWSIDSNEAWGAALDNVSVTAAAPVPEPATMLLFGTGLAGLAGIRRKKGKKA